MLSTTNQYRQPHSCRTASWRMCGIVLLIGVCGIIGASFLSGCASAPATTPGAPELDMGLASYYADRLHGRLTASGERYDRAAFTAAHRHLPFGTRVRVVRMDNGHAVDVRINDRGPFVKGRVIDLSHAAARELGMLRAGVVRVRVLRAD